VIVVVGSTVNPVAFTIERVAESADVSTPFLVRWIETTVMLSPSFSEVSYRVLSKTV
jgi:hypothetical protein